MTFCVPEGHLLSSNTIYLECFIWGGRPFGAEIVTYTAVQSQEAVSAYLENKQLLF